MLRVLLSSRRISRRRDATSIHPIVPDQLPPQLSIRHDHRPSAGVVVVTVAERDRAALSPSKTADDGEEEEEDDVA